MTDLYSFKGSYPYALPVNMTGYDIADFALAGSKPILQSGDVLDWTGTDWLVRGPNESEQALRIHAMRLERNQVLSSCDWTQVADAPVDAVAWATYRQALRELTAQPGFPWAIDWPVAP